MQINGGRQRTVTYKSQSASYDHAFIAAPARPGPLLNQQTLYTALSHARRGIHFWTNDRKAVEKQLLKANAGKTSALEGVGALRFRPDDAPPRSTGHAATDALKTNLALQSRLDQSEHNKRGGGKSRVGDDREDQGALRSFVGLIVGL